MTKQEKLQHVDCCESNQILRVHLFIHVSYQSQEAVEGPEAAEGPAVQADERQLRIQRNCNKRRKLGQINNKFPTYINTQT